MTREDVFLRIANRVGRHNVSCDCERCRAMCQRTPCLGTPHDILALIDAGYIDKVCYTEWAAGIPLGFINQPIPMVQIKCLDNGCCVLYHDGKCELHENGLKPTEGKLSHHEVYARELNPEYNLTFQVALEWTKEENFGVIDEIADKLCEYLDNKNMDNKELKEKYDKLVSDIETAKCYDGRNKGVDVYVCQKCGKHFYTRYKDKGVTPFTIRCRECNNGTATHEKTTTEQIVKIMGYQVHNWVRPSFEQFLELNEDAQQHVLNGGLMLEEELEKDNNVVKEEFSQVQKILVSLQNEDATCLFIGHEGNHFVISGDPNSIKAQLIFSMCRYPVVRDIIKECADRFDELNKEFGDNVRNVKMNHLIEQNSGN